MSKEAWRKCMEDTSGKHILHSLTENIPAIIANIEARAKCNALLTPEEIEELLKENKNWNNLFRDRGPLDPRRPGYHNRI